MDWYESQVRTDAKYDSLAQDLLDKQSMYNVELTNNVDFVKWTYSEICEEIADAGDEPVPLFMPGGLDFSCRPEDPYIELTGWFKDYFGDP